jgi:DNA-binding response OmpR family regulator
MNETPSIKTLIVDDNRIYRDAFRRNLLLHNYEVIEAEDAAQALAQIQTNMPDLVITDLQMRTETEGLDLIREVKSLHPLMPVIMISAVGTFEEGALAQKFGACSVISKSRIEDEIDRLYSAIERAYAELQQNRACEARIQEARSTLSVDEADVKPAVESLRTLLADPDTHPYLRGEAFNLFTILNERQLKEEARLQAERAGGGVLPKNLSSIEQILRTEAPGYDAFSEDSKETLRIAEFLYDQQIHVPTSIDFSRNIGFSYCFAVENEAKLRMARRLQKFLSTDSTYLMITEMLERNNQSLSVYYHQYLLLLMRGREMDFTIDNVKQTFCRIMEHQSRYKPDGLKALGIVILAFGRTYAWPKGSKQVKVTNPLQLKGLNGDDEAVRYAELLISLQHYRNPYIHPEISDLEKLSKIRATTFECLNMTSKLQ